MKKKTPHPKHSRKTIRGVQERNNIALFGFFDGITIQYVRRNNIHNSSTGFRCERSHGLIHSNHAQIVAVDNIITYAVDGISLKPVTYTGIDFSYRFFEFWSVRTYRFYGIFFFFPRSSRKELWFHNENAAENSRRSFAQTIFYNNRKLYTWTVLLRQLSKFSRDVNDYTWSTRATFISRAVLVIFAG